MINNGLNLNRYKFDGELYIGPHKGTYMDFPYDGKKEFGKRGPVRVKAWFDGKIYRMSLLPKGGGIHFMHLKKEILVAIGKREGDTVAVELEVDHEIPKIEIPDYLQWLFEDDNKMQKLFERMSLSMQKFWIGYIEEPKSDEGKVKRINKLFEYLRGNRK